MNSQKKTSTLASISGAVIALLLAFGSPLSQGASPDADAHGHGAGASQGAKASKGQPKSPSDADAQMKKMQGIHQRMMAAKTPEERAKLMDEQMQAMQQGMGMMNAMKEPHGGIGSNRMRDDMMEKRMDMMQMMMTMMMDRQSIENAPAAK
ncbi:hypothetical protein [Paraburkholderia graminis]|uniref:hypothetical protein n=1 Tax=Paraburkholderia graminis TaxID=60548 RepID=UPI0038B852C8